MADTITLTLSAKAVNGTDKKVIYDQQIVGVFTQEVTHHGHFTLAAAADAELHQFPDFEVLESAKKSLLIFVPDFDIQVAVGAVDAEKRSVKKDTPVVIQDIADEGKVYFFTANTEETNIVYFAGELA